MTWEEGIRAMESKNKTLILGALIGAATGLLAAMLLQRNAEKNERETAITTGEGLKLGVLVFGLLRAIASLGDEK
jgi:gas vesicle protein